MAFEQVSATVRATELALMRNLFLKDPNSVLPRHVMDFSRWPTSGANVRYVRADASGGGDGTTDVSGGATGAWTMAEFLAAQGGLSDYSRVYVNGAFNNVVVILTRANLLLDLRSSGTSLSCSKRFTLNNFTSTGINGEYKLTGADVANQVYTRFTGNKTRYIGLNPSDAGCRPTGTFTSGSQNLSLTNLHRALEIGDVVATSTAAGGLALSTPYYVVSIVVPESNGAQTVTISATLGGPAITFSSNSGAGHYFWSLFNGRFGVPIPGSLGEGEYAYAQWEDAIYMKPRSGDTEWHYRGANSDTTSHCITVAADNINILGGELHSAINFCVNVLTGGSRCGVWGTVMRSSGEGYIYALLVNPI